jgi:ribosome maturation factor RimP
MSQPGRETLIAQITGIAERVGSTAGIEVVDVEFAGAGKHRLLRITIDKPGGVTHGDCEFIANQVGAELDAGTWFRARVISSKCRHREWSAS